jgi:rhamnosyltransferase
MKNIFIVGSKGIPSNYGGFETFVEKLTEYKKSKEIKYHVACLSAENENEFEHNGARCFNVKVPEIGPAKAVVYDLMALNKVYKYIKENNIKDSLVYILACRVGPFISTYKQKFKKLGVPLLLNPDGHEWKRAKWSAPIRRYWKVSEKLMVKHADLVICDSMAIEEYIKDDYKMYSPNTTFIAYGATINTPAHINRENFDQWHEKWDLSNGYYLIVGRFVPENNYELMIKEFMKSKTNKSLVIVTNIEQNKFYNNLKASTHFDTDKRIKFVGTIYDEDLLYQVRKNAFAYFHGHEVGGTNPSLLEALAMTSLNILLDVQFNKEVGENAALYFSKKDNALVEVMERAESLSEEEIHRIGKLAKERIENHYSWDLIVNKYENLFLGL